MVAFGWQGESATKRGPPRLLRLPFFVVSLVFPLVADGWLLLIWSLLLVGWALHITRAHTLFVWLRLWLLLSVIYGAVLWFLTGLEVDGIVVKLGRFLLALLGIQILQWSLPPSDVVRATERYLPTLGLSLAIALRLVPRLERSAKWRLQSLEERGWRMNGGRIAQLRMRSLLWPGWFADALDHAHDLGDAVQSRGLIGHRRTSSSKFSLVPAHILMVLVWLLIAFAIHVKLPVWSGWWTEVECGYILGISGSIIFLSTLLPVPNNHNNQSSNTERLEGTRGEEKFPPVDLQSTLQLKLPDGRMVGKHDFVLSGGQIILIRGMSGCGKSSLLRVLAGVSPWQHPIQVTGQCNLRVGRDCFDYSEGPKIMVNSCWIPQDPARHGMAESVQREFELVGNMDNSVLIHNWGLKTLLSKKVEELSDGEHQRLLLAAHLNSSHPLWLLDEGDAHLDDEGFKLLKQRVIAHRDAGGLILLVAHREKRWNDVVSEVLVLDSGGGFSQLQSHSAADSAIEWKDVGQQKIGTIRKPTYLIPDEISLMDGINHLSLGSVKPPIAGEIIAIVGPNGSGKTTLLREVAKANTLPWLPTDPDQRLIGSTVEEELAWQDPQLSADSILRENQNRLVAELGLSELQPSTPVHDLSTGERRRLALLPLLLSSPSLLLIDEIDRALDDESLYSLVSILERIASSGTAIMLTTHSDSIQKWARRSGGRVWRIEDRLVREHRSLNGQTNGVVKLLLSIESASVAGWSFSRGRW